MDQPDAPAQGRAKRIMLNRWPETQSAHRLTEQVAGIVIASGNGKRAVGMDGRASLVRDTGPVLAGLLRPGWSGTPAEYHASPSGALWRDAEIGQARFKRITDAMAQAGLIGTMQRPRVWDAARGGAMALAPLMWPTNALTRMAANCGVTAEMDRADWRADPLVTAEPLDVPLEDLVTCRDAGADSLAGIDTLCREVAFINASNIGAVIHGAGRTVTLKRRFRFSLSLGGRFYAPVSHMAGEDRLRITINGEAVAEVDVKASQLSLLLGLTGCRDLPPDPYVLPGSLPREAVKAWCVLSLGSGRPAKRWGWDTSPDVRGVDGGVARVRRAALAAYPFFADLPKLVPAGVLANLPDDEPETATPAAKRTDWRGWGAGQWLVAQEATVLARALRRLAELGIPALPVHDSLIVPVSAVPAARVALTGAFRDLAGITPRLAVKRA